MDLILELYYFELKKFVDKTLECSAEKLEAVANLPYSATKEDLNSCNV